MGYGDNDEMGAGLSVTVIATGFETNQITESKPLNPGAKTTIHKLNDEPAVPSPQPFVQPQSTVQEQPSQLEPFVKEPETPETQGRIEFKLDAPQENTTSQPTVAKKEPLEPFVRKAQDAPQVKPQMEEPKPFVPNNPVQSAPPVSAPPASVPSTPVNTTASNEGETTPGAADGNQQTNVLNRIGKLKELSRRLRTASGLSELEDVPAYKRRSITLDDVPHSSESQVSRYSLDETGKDGEGKTQIGNNNSFLHDNVD